MERDRAIRLMASARTPYPISASVISTKLHRQSLSGILGRVGHCRYPPIGDVAGLGFRLIVGAALALDDQVDRITVPVAEGG